MLPQRWKPFLQVVAAVNAPPGTQPLLRLRSCPTSRHARLDGPVVGRLSGALGRNRTCDTQLGGWRNRLPREKPNRFLAPVGLLRLWVTIWLTIRPGSETHSLGWRRQQVEMLGWPLMVNALTVVLGCRFRREATATRLNLGALTAATARMEHS
jgi:hypothetical protein